MTEARREAMLVVGSAQAGTIQAIHAYYDKGWFSIGSGEGPIQNIRTILDAEVPGFPARVEVEPDVLDAIKRTMKRHDSRLSPAYWWQKVRSVFS